MNARIFFAVTFALTIPGASPLLAAEATEEGAQKIAGSLGAYLGKSANALSVTPDGESYKVMLDVAAVAAAAPVDGASVKAQPLTITLKDLGSGRWDVTQGAPVAFAAAMPGVFKIDFSIDDMQFHGIFDESLMSFSESTTTAAGLRLNEVVTQPAVGGNGAAPVESTIAYTIDSITSTTTGTAGTSGGVDGTFTTDATGIDEIFSMPPMPEMPAPQQIRLKASGYKGDGTIKGFKTAEALDLLAWAVAHPDKAAVTADFETLRNKARAFLPGWQSMYAAGALDALSVETPMGTFKAARGETVVEASGVTKEGRLREKLRLEGVTIPEGILPAWAAPLVPTEMTIDGAGSGFDLATAAGLFLDAVTPEGRVPPEVQKELAAAFVPSGTFDVKLGPSFAAGAPYRVDAEGAVTVNVAGGPPVGAFTIRAKGIDAVLEQLKSAPPEIGQQAGMGLMMARGLAKVEGPDNYLWAIDLSADGQVKINGTALPMAQ